MKSGRLASALIALVAAIAAHADEAYVRQISVGGFSVSLPEMPAETGGIDLAGFSAIGNPAAALSGTRIAIDVTGDPRVPAPFEGAYGMIASIGNENTALLLQTGNNAASIRQNGDDNLSALMQAGAGNRASIRQSGDGRYGSILQAGRGNAALIVQD